MKRYTGLVAAFLGLTMMILPSIASANIGLWQAQNNVPSAVLHEGSEAQPHLTFAHYHRPWACGNRHFRYHHPYMCR